MCKANPKYEQIHNKINEKNSNRIWPNQQITKTFLCKKCNKQYSVTATQYVFNKGTYKKHCSMACSNAHV